MSTSYVIWGVKRNGQVQFDGIRGTRGEAVAQAVRMLTGMSENELRLPPGPIAIEIIPLNAIEAASPQTSEG